MMYREFLGKVKDVRVGDYVSYQDDPVYKVVIIEYTREGDVRLISNVEDMSLHWYDLNMYAPTTILTIKRPTLKKLLKLL